MNEEDLMIQTNLATDEMVEPADPIMKDQSNPIQVLFLVNQQTIITEIESIIAEDIGQPDCRMVNPVLIKEDGTFSKFLNAVSDDVEMAISSDKILTLVDPNQSILEKYLEIIQ